MNNYYRSFYYIYLNQKDTLLQDRKSAYKSNNQQRKAYFDKRLQILQLKIEFADGLATKLGMKNFKFNNAKKMVA